MTARPMTPSSWRPRRGLTAVYYTLLPGTVVAALVLSTLLAVNGCAVWNAALQRLGVLGVNFSLSSVDVSGLVYPGNWLSSAFSAATGDRSALGGFGVDVRCQVKAVNPNPNGVVFDGGMGHLRVDRTGAADPDVAGSVPAFKIAGKQEALVPITFPLRLNSPVFSKSTWKKIIRGEDIDYKVDADLHFKFLDNTGYATLDSLGSQTVRMDVIKSSVNVKQQSGSLVQRFLSLLDAVL